MTQVYTTPLAVAQHCYELFANGDIETLVNDFLAPNVTWTEPVSAPNGGVHSGPQAVAENVFGAIPETWGQMTIVTENWISAGNNVVLQGRFTGTAPNGNTYDVPFCHVMTIENGKLLAFQNYTDTATSLAAING